MRRLFLLFVSVLSLLASTRLAAQSGDLTPYEIQRGELATATIEKIINTLGMYDKAAFGLLLQKALEQAEGDDYKALIISENIINKCCDLGETTRTEANLLAGSFDIGEAYTGQTLQAWREIGQWYKQERDKIEATKTDEDIQREKTRGEQIVAEPKTMLDLAKEKIRKQYLTWATKGTYEKTEAYNNRIAEKGPLYFDAFCFINITTIINDNILYEQLGSYDADNEGINIRFFYGEKGNEHSYTDAFWALSPDEHRHLSRSDFTNYKDTYSIGIFLKNGDIYPATYHSKSSEVNDIKLGPADTIIISMKDVFKGVDIPITEDHTFDYLSYSSSVMDRDRLLIIIKDLCGEGYSIDTVYGEKYYYLRQLNPNGGSYHSVKLPFDANVLLLLPWQAKEILDLVKDTVKHDLELKAEREKKEREALEAHIKEQQEAQKTQKKQKASERITRFLRGY